MTLVSMNHIPSQTWTGSVFSWNEQIMYLFILSPSQPCPSFVKTGPLLPVGIVQNLYLPVLFQVNDVDLVSTSSESRLFVCEYSDCSAVSKFLYRCHFDAFYLYRYIRSRMWFIFSRYLYLWYRIPKALYLNGRVVHRYKLFNNLYLIADFLVRWVGLIRIN